MPPVRVQPIPKEEHAERFEALSVRRRHKLADIMARYNAISYDSEESPNKGGQKQFGGTTRARRFFVAPEDLGKLKFYWEKMEHLKHW